MMALGCRGIRISVGMQQGIRYLGGVCDLKREFDHGGLLGWKCPRTRRGRGRGRGRGWLASWRQLGCAELSSVVGAVVRWDSAVPTNG